jgi:hypothetical protein
MKSDSFNPLNDRWHPHHRAVKAKAVEEMEAALAKAEARVAELEAALAKANASGDRTAAFTAHVTVLDDPAADRKLQALLAVLLHVEVAPGDRAEARTVQRQMIQAMGACVGYFVGLNHSRLPPNTNALHTEAFERGRTAGLTLAAAANGAKH